MLRKIRITLAAIVLVWFSLPEYMRAQPTVDCIKYWELCWGLDSVYVDTLLIGELIEPIDSCGAAIGSDSLPFGEIRACKVYVDTVYDQAAGSVTIGEDVLIDSTLQVKGNTQLDGTLDVDGLGTANANWIIGNGATSAGVLTINEDTDDGAHNTTFTVPALAGDVDYILPPDDGDADERLTTDGAGTLTWEAAGSDTATTLIDDAGCSLADTFLANGVFPRDSLEGYVGSKAGFVACGDSTVGGPWAGGVFYELFTHPGTQDHCGKIWQSSGGTDATDTIHVAPHDTLLNTGVIALHGAKTWVDEDLAVDGDITMGGDITNEGQQTYLLGPGKIEGDVSWNYTATTALVYSRPNTNSTWRTGIIECNEAIGRNCTLDSMDVVVEVTQSGDSLYSAFTRKGIESETLVDRSNQATCGFDDGGGGGIRTMTVIPTYTYSAQDSLQVLWLRGYSMATGNVKFHTLKLYVTDVVR